MNKYESTKNAMAVTAMLMLNGVMMSAAGSEDKLQSAIEEKGIGFDGFCGWLAEFAEYSESLLEQRNPQDFPGVYDYEVSIKVGELVCHYVDLKGKLPEDDEVKGWVATLAEEFFKQGEMPAEQGVAAPAGTRQDKWFIVCDTVCSGLTVSSGDIYDTEAEANAELAEVAKNYATAVNSGDVVDGDASDHGYSVVKGYIDEHGKAFDSFDAPITIEGEES